jgi:hypothetical protein
MKVIKPIKFQMHHLISTTATDAEAHWVPATTYPIGAIVTYSYKRYQSLQSANTGKYPHTYPDWWLDLGAANRYAMFDEVIETSTTATTSLTAVIKPGAIFDSVALIGMNAAIAKITVRDGMSGPVVYENIAGLSTATLTDWYEYFFTDPVTKRTQVLFQNIPSYLNAYITLELENEVGEPVSLAKIVYGTLSPIGQTQYGLNAGIVDYSVKETNEFGTTSFVERRFSKRLSAQVYVSNSQLNRVQSYLYSIRATPSVWIATEDPTYEEAAVVYGWYRDFSTDISYPTFSVLSLELESLT